MNRSIHLFIIGFLSLLVLFISGTFAACNANIASDCDCKPENIKGCDATGITVGGVTCGREINCSLLKHRFQVDINGNFCHLGTCSRECVCPLGNGDCTCSTGQ
ncbi:hypothetical protein RhiirA5_430985 [Rhizophagus irregularis]|uniref:Uncharacterized protein n=1 Tax=Rhizophagus irregularis TaxID=588596 RepID=A0A2N0QRC7_9GLOM|nr:hypothetical protein RhiirA5_430985 [Rhizophagus irregularis]PKC53602.1 hypothetical protein RhiirA1_478957 [Rhizophagus irregularis]CAB4484399.1 unnamed protein product [Rhizophagus irregularis]CAB5201451.1 unnamed protein product [Rhizophagus irregularis]CAB5349244.1 unnamed protein product [Rhizophagus irregularis]